MCPLDWRKISFGVSTHSRRSHRDGRRNYGGLAGLQVRHSDYGAPREAFHCVVALGYCLPSASNANGNVCGLSGLRGSGKLPTPRGSRRATNDINTWFFMVVLLVSSCVPFSLIGNADQKCTPAANTLLNAKCQQYLAFGRIRVLP